MTGYTDKHEYTNKNGVTSVVYLMDCMKAMEQIGDKEFALACVDPPYGIGMDGGNVGYKGSNNFEKKNWDKETPNDKYFVELYRTSKNYIIWGGNYFNLPPARCYLVWDKGEGFYGRTYAECEIAWTSFDKNAKIFKRDPLANGDYKGKMHPTQKPIALYDWIFKNYAKPNDTILDTHLGSGSSRIAADRANLPFTGIELDPDYFRDHCKRFDRYTSQLTIF